MRAIRFGGLECRLSENVWIHTRVDVPASKCTGATLPEEVILIIEDCLRVEGRSRGTKRLQACNRDLTDLSNDDLDNVLRQRCKVLGDQAFETGPYEPESTFALTIAPSLGPAYEGGGLLVRVYLLHYMVASSRSVQLYLLSCKQYARPESSDWKKQQPRTIKKHHELHRVAT
jgi:hypothetical protein